MFFSSTHCKCCFISVFANHVQWWQLLLVIYENARFPQQQQHVQNNAELLWYKLWSGMYIYTIYDLLNWYMNPHFRNTEPNRPSTDTSSVLYYQYIFQTKYYARFLTRSYISRERIGWAPYQPSPSSVWYIEWSIGDDDDGN